MAAALKRDEEYDRRLNWLRGIPDLIRMPDLADRAFVVELLPRSSYAPLVELDAAFERDRPKMLGALYDAISAAIKCYAGETPSPGVRLVDLEKWARAALPQFGFGGDAVSAEIIENRLTGDRILVEDDPTASLLLRLLDDNPNFRGTASSLLNALRLIAPVHDLPLLPKGPRALLAHLSRFVIPFERIGIALERERGSGRDRERLWVIQFSRDERNSTTVTEEF